MSQQATAMFRAVVSPVCEREGCTDDSKEVFVVTGDLGEDGLAAYCRGHADELDESDDHTPIGEVEHV